MVGILIIYICFLVYSNFIRNFRIGDVVIWSGQQGEGGSNRNLNQGFARAVGLATLILLAPFSILNVISDHVLTLLGFMFLQFEMFQYTVQLIAD